jgi:outer membrane protein TolC
VLAVGIVAPSSAQEATGARTLTLAEAVELASRHDPAAIAAEVDVTRARADRLEARGTFLPSVAANGFYSNSSNERFDQTTGRLVSESYTAQLQGSYELFAGGRRLLDNRAADRELDAARAIHRARAFESELIATEAFYAVAASSDLVDVAAQRLTRAQQQNEFARTRLELGTATTSDALRAEIEVANAELALHEARSALNIAAFSLGRITGLGGAVYAERHSLPAAAPELPPLEELLARADQGAPAVLAAEAVESSARALRYASMSAYLPSLRLTGGYDWFSFEFPPDQESWSMRLFASVPIFNGFQREATVQRALATQDLAEAQARDARLAARAEVQAAAAEIELAEQRVAISTRTVALAEEDLRVQEERYRIGAATILELQTSQVALAEAQINAVRSKQSLGGAVARLEAILGETLDG